MAVVVKNESAKAYIFEKSAGQRQIAAGETTLLSDTEWGSVITAKRGPGNLNALWPTELSSEANQIRFDYILVGSTYEVLYLGYAVESALDTDSVWTIKKFDYTTLASVNKPTHLQVFKGVKWTDRTTLPWT